MNPEKNRSPGPVQNTTSDFMCRHSTRFIVDERFRSYIDNPHALQLNPDNTLLQPTTPNVYFPNSHETWHKTYNKEKERYMTCTGETANYNQKDDKKDLGAKYTKK